MPAFRAALAGKMAGKLWSFFDQLTAKQADFYDPETGKDSFPGGNSSVRMILPPLACRRIIDRSLSAYFRAHKAADFRRAVAEFCRFYNIKRPKVEWYEYIDWGKTAGKTYENGRIHLIHPENWKRGRIHNTERMWIQVVYHEMGHFLFWTDAERKADVFTRRMVRGLRATSSPRPARSVLLRPIAGKRLASQARSKARGKVSSSSQARSARS